MRARSNHAPEALHVAAKSPAATRPHARWPVSRAAHRPRRAITPSEATKDTSRGAVKPAPAAFATSADT